MIILSTTYSVILLLWEPKKLSSEVGSPNLIESKVIEKLTSDLGNPICSILLLEQHLTSRDRGPTVFQNVDSTRVVFLE